ncbi:alpha-1,2-fucosyltransferase [Desertivirga xinjiangensis]|uniref:alpha-1,2-fucosyltransferase n=1 Tax=Desertivirga xinjiangensis TaxID=539206 RepID=UPI00210A3478|nr:alpha-1,2-fucosyltransferase [Pedobacter xinjiangensis]
MRNSPKVVARLFGGVGNQLFIYAFARALSLKSNMPLFLDSYSGFIRDSYKRTFQLNNFTLKADKANLKDCLFFFINKRFSLVTSVFYKKPTLIKEKDQTLLDKSIMCLDTARPAYIEGYWQSYKYFSDYETQIRSDLNFGTTFSEANTAIQKKIISVESIAIHIRRIQYEQTLDLSYYYNSLDYLLKKVANPHLFIFSDDPEWCKVHFTVTIPVTYIDKNKDDEIADLWLMSHCRYFIIANSSFSWWGAWLSRFPQKVVIAPKNRELGVKGEYYPSNWVQMI